MSRKSHSLVLFVVMILTALSQTSETIYAASLPKIAENLGVSKFLVQYTLTSFFIGFAIGTLLWGNLSDKIGRKSGLFCGLSIYVCGSFLCWFSSSIEYLIIMRFVQGLGASVGSVMGQAIVRDIIKPEDRVGFFVKINIFMSFVPAIGLITGDMVAHYFAWQEIFLVLMAIGVFIMINSVLFIPAIKVNKVITRRLFMDCLTQVVHDRKGLMLGFFVGGSLGLLFGYFAESGFYFMEMFKVSCANYGLISIFVCVPLFIGGMLNRHLKRSPDYIIYLGTRLLLISASIFYLLVYLGIISLKNNYFSLLLSILFIDLVLISIWMIIPNCLSQVLGNYGKYIGTASSIFGFYYYIVTALFITIMTSIHGNDLHSLPLFFLISSILICLVHRTGGEKGIRTPDTRT